MFTNSEIIDVLRDARSLLERGWCHYAEALDENDKAVPASDKRAIKWCALGALIAATNCDPQMVVGHPAYDEVTKILGHHSLNGFNDRQKTVESVLELFDKTINTVVSRITT